MTVTVYHSTDSSAPVLSGQVGSLISVLDAILVNGYGAKAAVGWTKSYSGTNKAAYRQSAGSNQFYLRVDDSATQDCRVVGYETMSDVDTGTGAFPTAVQQPGGLYHYKSNAASSAARSWFAISNGKIFYFVSSVDGTNLSQMLAFGDITSYKSGDAYHTIIAAAPSTGPSQAVGATLSGALGSALNGHYMARSYTQLGTAVAVAKHTDYVKSNMSLIAATNGLPYPNGPDGALWFAPLWVHEPVAVQLRGEMPGVYCPLHTRPLTSLDTFNGSGSYAGKTFEAIAVNSSSSTGQLFFETSDTW